MSSVIQNKDENKVEPVQLSALPPAKLLQLREQMQEEINELGLRMQQLNVILTRFSGSRESLDQFRPKNKDAVILAPISQSIYIDAKLNDIESILVDIGTGYYVEMSIEKTKTHFDKKVEIVKKSIEKINKSIIDKNKIFEAINSLLIEHINSQNNQNSSK
ncbi:hypothetical protein FG386_002787 [Cryptosporidium ryanae]|uniref:uncharacterized protein n=1 Tax=Cryptosporidium ryanae TaxID=515981 RepID=UPI00351A8F42|nr:hypothetical protein FG386_002787 [Cryptosporidium ryanae]